MKAPKKAYRLLIPAIAIFFLIALVSLGDNVGAFATFDASDGGRIDAANGRIFFGNGPNATSSIISFQPGSSPIGAGTTLGRGYHPAVSPDGMTVAFVDNTAGPTNSQIMLMNHDGTNRRPLPNPATGFTPTWSPDGTRLAYVVGNFAVGQMGSGDIYVMDMTPGNEGANQTKIPNTSNTSQPNWGSNNFLVFYGRTGGAGPAKLGPVPPTANITSSSPLPVRILTGGSNDNCPVWSPDATRIAFRSYRDSPNFSNSEIYTSDPDGGNVTRVTNDSQHNLNPTWAPDGTRIAFETPTSLRDVAPNGSDGANPPLIRNGAVYFPQWGVLPGSVTPTPTPVPGADLNVTLVDLSTSTPGADQELSYKVRLRNLGPQASANTTLRIEIPSNTFLLTPIAACTRIGTGRNYDCSIGSMASGTERIYDIRLRTRVQGPITLYAGATSNSPDPTPGDRSVQRQLQVSDVPRPSNDNLANAQAIPGEHATINGTNVNATIEPMNNIINSLGETMHASQAAGKSVWYAWRSPVRRGTVKVSTAGSSFDTLLDVYEFTQTPLRIAASNDDAPGVTTSAVSFRYQPDTFYYFAVDGFAAASGSITLKVDVTPFVDPGQYRVLQKITGFAPAATCSEISDPNDLLCGNRREPNGVLRLTIKGENFTPDSKVLIDGEKPRGFDRNNNPVPGDTTYISSTELLVRVPPKPALLIQRIADASVMTPVTINGEVYQARAHNTARLKILDLKNAVVPAGETREVCGAKLFNKEGGETCLSMVNFGPGTMTVSPTWFAAVAYCEGVTGNTAMMLQCAENMASGKSFSLNPKSGTPGQIAIKKKFKLPPGSTMATNLHPKATVSGGRGLIGLDGSTLIGQDGGLLVGHDGSSLVGHDGSSLVGHDGSSLIGQDGSTLIGQDGGTLRMSAGNLIGLDGSTRPDPFDLDWLLRGEQTTEEPVRPASPTAPGDLVNGSAGFVVAKGTGGSEPTVTYEYDDVTGEAFATVSMILDNTSSPKVTNLSNIVFSIGLNPAVIKLQSTSVSVDEGAGSAVVMVERTGDTSAPASIDYTTTQGSEAASCVPASGSPTGAGERCDYAAKLGTVRFAANETSKEIRIPIIDDKYSEGSETFKLIIGNALGAAVELPSAATVTITDNDASTGSSNPLDAADAQFFVRQQYLDLLGREPLAAELVAGTGPIVQCGSDLACRKTKSVDLSHAIFSQAQQSWGFVFRLYRAAFGNNQPFPIADTSNPPEAKKWPAFQTVTRDRAMLTDGPELARRQLELVNSFVLRPAFTQKYSLDALSEGPAFVDAVIATIRTDSGVDLVAQRTSLINLFDQAGGSMAGRAAVMYRLADASQTNPINNSLFVNAEDARSFASTLHFGYLKRDGTLASLTPLTAQLQAATDRKPFIDQFVHGGEYRLRFGPSDASATVTGRVLTPTGQGLRNASVSLITAQGQRRMATTSSFGLFSFADVPVGSTYTVTVGSKRYRFAPRTIQLSGNLNLGDLTGLE